MKAWRRVCGFYVHELVPITCRDWKRVDDNKKKELWTKIKQYIKFPKGTKKIAKKATLVSCGVKFRHWKAELNNNFLKKNIMPKHMGKITEAQWKEFVVQKTDANALALSEANSNKAKKNIYPHHLGSSGYAPKIPKWREQLEQLEREGKRPLRDCDDRGVYWVLGRSEVTKEGEIKVKTPKVQEVAQKLEQVAAQQRLGLFKPIRENDQLTAALGNPEHTGRVRGISSRASRKEGFPADAPNYKKRDRYKLNLEQTIEEKVNNAFKAKLMRFVQELAEAQTQGSDGHEVAPGYQLFGQLSQSTAICTQATPSTAVVTATRAPSPTPTPQDIQPATSSQYPVDDIKVDTPCRLHVPTGRTGNMSKAVATGIAMPGRIIHNNPIPSEYAKVSVMEITDKEYMDYELDIAMPDDITELGHAINSFILWNKKDIELVGPSSTQQQQPAPPAQSNQGEQELIMTISDDEPPARAEEECGTSNNEPPAAIIDSAPQRPSSPPAAEQDLTMDEVPQRSPPSSPHGTESVLATHVPPPQRSPSPEKNLQEGSSVKKPVVHKEVISYQPKRQQAEVTAYLESLRNRCVIKQQTSTPINTMLVQPDETWEEEGKVWTRKDLYLRPNEPVYKKDDVPEKFVNGRPFMTTVQLSAKYLGIRRLHNWYMVASSLGLSNFSYIVPENAFWSGETMRTVEFSDLWDMFHKQRLEASLVTIFCL